MKIEEIISRNLPCVSEEYKKFAIEKDQCRECSLYKHSKQVVQSEGSTKNPIFMFIGEAPEKDEVAQNRPFIGLAGQKLRSELRKHSKVFRRNNVLISNILACRPLDNEFPGLQSLEVKSCTKKWLDREIFMVRPKIIITLGDPATRYVRGDSSIAASRGKWEFSHQYRAWTLATYHPSYVIRSEQSGQNHIVDQFCSDIKTVATLWKTMIGDNRLSFSEEEWKRKRAMLTLADLGLMVS